jgi:hypothetical protein
MQRCLVRTRRPDADLEDLEEARFHGSGNRDELRISIMSL